MPEPVRAVTKRLPDLAAIEAAADFIRPIVAPTPQILWPLLSQRAGAEVWVKHENHTLVGAFKIRGGLIYMHELKRREPAVTEHKAKLLIAKLDRTVAPPRLHR